MRYDQLTPLLQDIKPATIIEVGTWDGTRAIQMMNAARGMVYFGFDLFEDGTPDNDAAELNVKRRTNTSQVSATLQYIPHKLYRGYSADTLGAFGAQYGFGRVDFAYIDGGHAVETIATDWEWCRRLVKPGGVVVFDDYYTGCEDSDLDKFGCNRVVEKLDHKILPVSDGTKMGWSVQMVMVTV